MNDLVQLANQLDQRGFTFLADRVDDLLKTAQEDQTDKVRALTEKRHNLKQKLDQIREEFPAVSGVSKLIFSFDPDAVNQGGLALSKLYPEEKEAYAELVTLQKAWAEVMEEIHALEDEGVYIPQAPGYEPFWPAEEMIEDMQEHPGDIYLEYKPNEGSTEIS